MLAKEKPSIVKKSQKKLKENSSDLVHLVKILDALQKKEINLDKALEFICEISHAERALLVLLSPQDGDLYIEAAAGLSAEQKKQGHYVLGEGIVGKVIQSGKPMIIHDIMHNPLFLNRTHARTDRDNISFLCVPILFDTKVIGALGIDRLTCCIQDSAHEERMLSLIASFFVPSIKVHQESMQKSDTPFFVLPKIKKAKARYLVGNAESMQLVYQRIEQAAPSSTTIMLRGESGTGKELVARALHEQSPRKAGPFITLNCAALPESLVESELFGHEKGAFTGAVHERKGRFELADQGTLFLDEVGELSLATQARLLRVLQEKSFERVGGAQSVQVDVRIVTATHRPLEKMLEEGSFRQDLYYRLNVFTIFLPALREKQSDILILAEHFLKHFAKANQRNTAKISLAAASMLQKYSYPGNIRELENIIERATILIGEGQYLLPQHLPLELHSRSCPEVSSSYSDTSSFCEIQKPSFGTLPERIAEFEKASIIEALLFHKGHIGAAAKFLGITERVMGQRIKKYELKTQDYKAKL